MAKTEVFCNVINTTTVTRAIRLSGAALLALALAACAAQTPEPGTPEPVEDAVSHETLDGNVMEMPLDGSSLEAFEKSLARVKAHTSPEDYTTLANAIEYLLFYDLSARRDRAKLASHLDGLTPDEVIAKVNARRDSHKGDAAGERPSDAAIDL